MAWLNTVAEKQTQSRLAVYRALEEQGHHVRQLEMPERLGFEYLVHYLFEAGPVGNNGFGPEPLTWQEIEAWSRLTQVKLDAWEALTLRTLSDHYRSQLMRSADPKCRAPDQPEQSREQIAEDVEAFFDRIDRQQKRGGQWVTGQ